ncbi:uncharacterized protein LOC143630312 [Bidens hawaiensis]|uniref:uncharacterized protein LOC143630312 n=1 Tax=Bidens hawaiensis TaxID=980011 RepID=UPI00404A78A9
MEKALACYGVTDPTSTAYYPQTNGQVENANREVKRILEKSVGISRKDWSERLDDAPWAFRTAYKTPLGTTPFMLVYGKSCHLPVKLEHRAFWPLKTVNLDLTEASRKRYFQIHELEELHDAVTGIKVDGPNLVKKVFPYEAVELKNPNNGTPWKVNSHRLKHYLGGPEDSNEADETHLDPSN